MLDTLLQDLRYALRGLRHAPGFGLAVVVTLGLGIGINAVAFGAIDALLLRPPAGVGDPAGAFRVEVRPPVHPGQEPLNSGTIGVTFSEFEALRADGAFEPLAAQQEGDATLGNGRGAEVRRVAFVSGEYFTALRVRPALGQLFTSADARAMPPAAVLSYDFWRSRYGGDPEVVGRSIEIGGHRIPVIGIAGKGFAGLRVEPVSVWLTLTAYALLGHDVFQNGERLDLLGRPRPGLSPEAAAARLTGRIAADRLTYAWQPDRSPFTVAVPLRQRYGPNGESSPVPPWALVVTAAVLLVACANVAGLLLARGARRRQEIAVRVALGAGRRRIFRQLLTETILLAAAGATLGLALTTWGGALLPLIGVPRLSGLLSSTVLAGTGVMLMLVALLAGLAPAWRASAVNMEAALKAGARTTSDRSRLRAALTVGQLALCLALLVSAGFFGRSLRNAWTLPLGFDPDHLLLVDVQVPAGSMSKLERTLLRVSAAERLQRLPMVVAAARASMAPLRGLYMPDVLLPNGGDAGMVVGTAVDPDYFHTLEMHLLEGRVFDARDQEASSPVAVVGPALAHRLWPGRSPVGQCLRLKADSGCTTVVGMVEDVRITGVLQDPPAQFYRPFAQWLPDWSPGAELLVRTRGRPEDAEPAVRAAVLALDPRILRVEALPYREEMAPALAPWRTATRVVSAAAVLTLLLTLVGVYGLIAYMAQERAREMGIRVALGAGESQIRRLVLREGVRLTVAGVGLGMLLAFAAARLLRSRFYGVTGTEPVTYLAGALLLACAALAATYLPARAAARANPLDALRAE